MPADVDHQRQLCRDAYGESVVQTYQRLGTADSEYVRLNALKQLARIVGIVELLAQLHDLSVNARSEWIALRANDIIADYLQLFSENAADNRPEALSLDLAEQLAVQQQLEAERANLPPVDPDDLAYYRSALSDPPQPTQQLPADAASDDDTDADQPDDDQPTEQPPAADHAAGARNAAQPADNAQPDDRTDQPEPPRPAADQPEAIERLFQQAEQLADRLASQPDPDLDPDPPT